VLPVKERKDRKELQRNGEIEGSDSQRIPEDHHGTSTFPVRISL
jgi:hypothetical protein